MKLNDEIRKNNPFKVPEGYFDTLTEKTMSAIRNSGDGEGAMPVTGKPARRISLKPFLALAAAILGFALITTVVVRVLTDDRAAVEYEAGNDLYAELAAEELDTWMIETELSRIEMVDITEAEKTISSDIIIDYLMTEEIDLDDIYELL